MATTKEIISVASHLTFGKAIDMALSGEYKISLPTWSNNNHIILEQSNDIIKIPFLVVVTPYTKIPYVPVPSEIINDEWIAERIKIDNGKKIL